MSKLKSVLENYEVINDDTVLDFLNILKDPNVSCCIVDNDYVVIGSTSTPKIQLPRVGGESVRTSFYKPKIKNTFASSISISDQRQPFHILVRLNSESDPKFIIHNVWICKYRCCEPLEVGIFVNDLHWLAESVCVKKNLK